jgi:uncharacterized protein (TIGR03067 family)
MRHRALIALSVISLASAAAPGDDKAKLQGSWVCMRVKMGGLSGTAKGEGNVPVGIRFEGDCYVGFNGKTDSPKGDFRLDPTKHPKQMDLIDDDVFPPLAGGPKGKTTVPCIYELEGDKLKVCMGSNGRPKAFASRDNGDFPDAS